MKKKLHYYFEYIDHCEMCGDSITNHKILGQRLNQSQGIRPKSKFGVTTSVMRCTSCGLIYTNPMPIPYSIQDHYGIPPEDYWKPSYFQIEKDYLAGQINTFKSLQNFKAGMRALDVGTGIGKGMIALSEAGFDTHGFEASKPFYEHAIKTMGIPAGKLQLGMIEDVDYESSSFDFINFGAVLEHFYNPALCVARGMKWLKSGGIMHIEIPSSDYLMSKVINTYYRFLGTRYVTNLSPMHEPFHLYEFNVKSFESLAKKLDFKIVHHEFYVCSAAPFPKFMHGLVNYIMKKTNTGMQLAIWLQKK